MALSHRMPKRFILTAGSDESDSSPAGVAKNYTQGHDKQESQCWTVIYSKYLRYVLNFYLVQEYLRNITSLTFNAH
jgi:hypothetical protein